MRTHSLRLLQFRAALLHELLNFNELRIVHRRRLEQNIELRLLLLDRVDAGENHTGRHEALGRRHVLRVALDRRHSRVRIAHGLFPRRLTVCP